MRSERTAIASEPTASNAEPAPWMKPAFIVISALFFISVLVIWDQWESAQTDLTIKNREHAAKLAAYESLLNANKTSGEFLNKYNNDADFRMRVARQRLGYTEPGEVVLRLDPPPKPVNPPPDTAGK